MYCKNRICRSCRFELSLLSIDLASLTLTGYFINNLDTVRLPARIVYVGKTLLRALVFKRKSVIQRVQADDKAIRQSYSLRLTLMQQMS